MFIILLFFSALSGVIDLYIYKHLINRYITGAVLKWIYKIQSLVFALGSAVIVVSYAYLSEELLGHNQVLLMWLILIFLINLSAKTVFVLFVLFEHLLVRIFSKHYRGLVYMGFLLSLTIVSIMIYGASIGRSRIRVEHVNIVSSKLPQSFDGYKIAQVSDLHIGNLSQSDDLVERMVRRINSLEPDIIVISGDLVNIHSGELNDKFISELSQLKSKDGIFSVIGNHDLGIYIHDTTYIHPHKSVADLIEKQKRMGWQLLRNENRAIVRDTDSLFVAGITYPQIIRYGVRNSPFAGSDLRKAMDSVPDSLFSLLIAHSPQIWDSIPKVAKPTLTIAGHVHAMQAKITIGKSRWSPAKLLFPLWSGLYKDRGRYLYINDGIGYVLYPMRVGTNPEITLYEINRL